MGLGAIGGMPVRGVVLGPPQEARTLTRPVGTGLAKRLAATGSVIVHTSRG